MTQAWSEEMEWDTEVDFIRCMVSQQPVQDVAFVMGGHGSRLLKVHAWSSDVYNYRQSRMWPFSHGCSIHKVVIRCVQQPVQDVAFVLSAGPMDSLGHIESGQAIHHSGGGWVQMLLIKHAEVAVKSPRTTEEACKELQCSNKLWS